MSLEAFFVFVLLVHTSSQRRIQPSWHGLSKLLAAPLPVVTVSRQRGGAGTSPCLVDEIPSKTHPGHYRLGYTVSPVSADITTGKYGADTRTGHVPNAKQWASLSSSTIIVVCDATSRSTVQLQEANRVNIARGTEISTRRTEVDQVNTVCIVQANTIFIHSGRTERTPLSFRHRSSRI